MLIGKYYYSLDEKGRISLPKVFRDQAETWIITRGLDGCLFIFEQNKFAQELSQLTERTFTKKANRDLSRLMANEATLVQADHNGRVHLPEYLIEFAQLKKDLVIVGSGNHIEVWERQRYHNYLSQLESHAETIAEQLSLETKH